MSNSIKISNEMLDELRHHIRKQMSGFRLAHTLGVETMAAKIAQLMCPEKENKLRAAALLHDITKELSFEQQKNILTEHGHVLSMDEENSPAILHAITASLLIPQQYTEFADIEIVDAVRYHTTGRIQMSICEKIIYLSDYIDITRTYSDCELLRKIFWDAHPEKMSAIQREIHLCQVLKKSFDLTITDLIERGQMISKDSIEARNYLILEINDLQSIIDS